MRAAVAAEVPDLDCAVLIAGDEFALVRMQGEIIDGRLVGVVALLCRRSVIIVHQMVSELHLTR